VLKLAPEYNDEDEFGVPTAHGDRTERHRGRGGAGRVEGADGLQELDLAHRNIGAEGLKALVGAAKALPALRRLNLLECGLTFPAVKSLADSALGAEPAVRELQDTRSGEAQEDVSERPCREPYEYAD